MFFPVGCDDNGFPFIETVVASDTSKVQKTPEMDSLDQILPFKPHELKLTDQVNLRVQINYFDCGGVVIGVCYKHITADACNSCCIFSHKLGYCHYHY